MCDLSPISLVDVRDLTTEELFAVLQPGVEESVKARLEKFIRCELEESIRADTNRRERGSRSNLWPASCKNVVCGVDETAGSSMIEII